MEVQTPVAIKVAEVTVAVAIKALVAVVREEETPTGLIEETIHPRSSSLAAGLLMKGIKK